jgi:hypothetical protein
MSSNSCTYHCGSCPAQCSPVHVGIDCAAEWHARQFQPCQRCVAKQFVCCQCSAPPEHALASPKHALASPKDTACPQHPSDTAEQALSNVRGVYQHGSQVPHTARSAFAATVLVTMADRNAFRLLINLLCSLEGLKVKLAVATLDGSAAAWVGARSTQNVQQFNWPSHVSFYRLGCVKIGLVSYIFSLGHDLLMVDADTVWLADPLLSLSPLVLEQSASIIAQTGPTGGLTRRLGACGSVRMADAAWNVSTLDCACGAWRADPWQMMQFGPPQPASSFGFINSGFLWMRGSPVMRAFVDEASARTFIPGEQINGGGDDQQAYHATLCDVPMRGHKPNRTWEHLRQSLRLALVDTRLIANAPTTLGMGNEEFGHRVQHGEFDQRINFTRPRAAVLHATWNVQDSRPWVKEAFFRRAQAWCGPALGADPEAARIPAGLSRDFWKWWRQF